MELMAKAKSIQAEIECCKQIVETNRRKLDSYTEDCKKDITVFRREINMMLDKLEKDILSKLDKAANQKLQVIEKQIADMASSLHALSADLVIMNKANKINNDEIIFAANAKVSRNLTEYDSLIQEIRNGMQKPELKIQKNKSLVDILRSVEGLGTI